MKKRIVSSRRYTPPYYPYRYMPPELHGAKYLDMCPEFLGQDQMFSDIDPTGQYTSAIRDEDISREDEVII